MLQAIARKHGYTAIYLQSDGSFEDFVMKCTKISDEKNLLQYFEGKIDAKVIKKINKEKDPEKRASFSPFSDLAPATEGRKCQVESSACCKWHTVGRVRSIRRKFIFKGYLVSSNKREP